MKKLMIAAAIVCAVSIVQAATCTWTTAANYWNGAGESASATTGTKLGNGDVTGYLFYFTGATAAEDYAAALNEISGQDEGTAAWAKSYVENHTAAKSKSTKAAGTLSLSDGVNYAQNTVLYGVVIAKTTQGGTDYYYANAATFTMGTADATVSNMNKTLGGSAQSSSTEITWNAAAVPEPFSGALALLGMGAIALRRKMRKAKKA